MVGRRDARSAAKGSSRGARANRAGLSGWAWRDLRHAIKLGKRHGASAVKLNKHGVEVFFCAANSAAGQQVPELQPSGNRPVGAPSNAARAGRAPQEAPAPMDTGGPAVKPERMRKLKSAARLKEFQQSKRLAKLRGTLLRAMKRVRFDRMWRVHN